MKSFCDSIDDCGDMSDEQPLHCGKFTFSNNFRISSKFVECTSWDSFICDTGVCIDESLRCNGHPDCGGGEDELDCEEEEICLNGQLRCHKNNKCIGL